MGTSAGKSLIDLSQIAFIPADATDIPIIFGFCKELIDSYEDVSAIAYDKVLNWVLDKITNKIDMYQCAVVDGTKLGYFCLDTTGTEAELDDLYVLPEYRGIGIGTSIIRYCIRRLRKPVFLYVFSKNIGAVRLYNRMGFAFTEKVGSTRVVMRREC